MEPDPKYVTVAPPAHIDMCRVNQVLDKDHQQAFTTALLNILRTEVAETTLAQIVDGLPLKHVAFSLSGHRYTIHDPVATHTELCPGALEKTKAFRQAFDPALMNLRTDILERYQIVPADSRAARLVLVELVAVAIHAIAVELFKLDSHGPHKKETRCPAKDPDYWDDEDHLRRRFPPWPTSFALCAYTAVEQYPDGVADLAGYWAECLIFGGVVLFGRGESDTGYDGVWFHSHHRDVTRRIYSLTDDQIAALVRFLQSEARDPHPREMPECPLPILGDSNNRRRVDPEIAMPEHNVFRDRWERKQRFKNYLDYESHRHCSQNSLDYPEKTF